MFCIDSALGLYSVSIRHNAVFYFKPVTIALRWHVFDHRIIFHALWEIIDDADTYWLPLLPFTLDLST